MVNPKNREPLDFDIKNQEPVVESLRTEPNCINPITIRITNLALQDEDGVILEFKSYNNQEN